MKQTEAMGENMLDENNLKALVSLLSDDDEEILNHVEGKIISSLSIFLVNYALIIASLSIVIQRVLAK